MPRANLQFGLAHVLDARQRYDEAARTTQRGQRRQSGRAGKEIATISARRPRAVRHQHHRRVPARDLHAAGRRGAYTRRPVFVFGLPRSGTTLIEQVLASHSMIHGAGEMALGRKDFEAIPGLLDRHGDPSIACLEDPRIAHGHPQGGRGPRRPARRAGRTRHAGRRQDARQLHVPGPTGRSCSPTPRSSTAGATCATSPSPAG